MSPRFHRAALARCGMAAVQALAVLVLVVSGAMAGGRLSAPDGVAVGGYDPVAYFAQGAATVGRPDIALRWRGVRWHFSSAANRAAFEADPQAFAPQFGGYCVLALGEGRMVPGDPKHWIVHEGRLYLTETGPGRDRDSFAGQIPQMVTRARSAWSGRPGN